MGASPPLVRGGSESWTDLEQEIFGQSLLPSDLARAPAGPRGILAVAPVERVVDHDLPSGEELDMGSTDAQVRDLLMP